MLTRREQAPDLSWRKPNFIVSAISRSAEGGAPYNYNFIIQYFYVENIN